MTVVELIAALERHVELGRGNLPVEMVVAGRREVFHPAVVTCTPGETEETDGPIRVMSVTQEMLNR